MIHCQPWPAAVRLGFQHEAELIHFLLGLDGASRILRFAHPASDGALLVHAHRALEEAAWIGGIFVEQRLRGVVELYDLAAHGLVEAAFLVDSGWRRRGLGTALLQAAQGWTAGNHRVVIRMVFSTANWPMRKLADRAGARLDLCFGEMTAEIAVGARHHGGLSLA